MRRKARKKFDQNGRLERELRTTTASATVKAAVAIAEIPAIVKFVNSQQPKIRLVAVALGDTEKTALLAANCSAARYEQFNSS